MAANKTELKILLLGHVGSGKSTTIGRIIYLCGEIDKGTLGQLETDAQEVFNLGQGSFQYSWILKFMKKCRDKGIPIDDRLMKFNTPRYYVTVVDAPGHRAFMKNIITGTSRADCALLIVGSSMNEFERGQTQEHIQLSYTMGIKNIIVGVNKMELTDPPYSQERFQEIQEEVLEYLELVGYQPDSVAFVPISGLKGDNILANNNNMGPGLTLIRALDSIQMPLQPNEKPLRLPVQAVYKDWYEGKGFGTLVMGQIETGIIQPNMMVTFAPQFLTTEVNSVKWNQQFVDGAGPGDNVGVFITNVSWGAIRRGNVCSNSMNDPARQVTDFTAIVVVMNHPGRMRVGDTAVLACHKSRISCRFSEFLKKIDPRSGRVIQYHLAELKSGDVALIKITPLKPMCVETLAEYPHLGRFSVRVNHQTILVGVIQSVTKMAFEGNKCQYEIKENRENINLGDAALLEKIPSNPVRLKTCTGNLGLFDRSPMKERTQIGK